MGISENADSPLLCSREIKLMQYSKDDIQKEILKAVKEISEEVKKGTLSLDDIDEKCFEDHLYTKDFPQVDLMIRTSGEVRISNFLLWQIAYAELQFLDVLWPDFTKDTFFQCILDYQNKERRYGKTSEQLLS